MATTNPYFTTPYSAPERWAGDADAIYEALVTAVHEYALPALPLENIRRGWQNGVSLPPDSKDYAIITVLGRTRRGTNFKVYEPPALDAPKEELGALTERTLREATVQVSFFSASDAGAARADSLVTICRGSVGASHFRQWGLGVLYAEDTQAPDWQDGTKIQVRHSVVTLRLAYWSGIKARLPFISSVVVEPRPDVLLDND